MGVQSRALCSVDPGRRRGKPGREAWEAARRLGRGWGLREGLQGQDRDACEPQRSGRGRGEE